MRTGLGNDELMDLELEGWAVDGSIPAPVETVAFFVNGVYAGALSPELERPDVRDAYASDDVILSGFLARLRNFSLTGELEVPAFGNSEGTATELEIVESIQDAIRSGALDG